MKSMFAIALLLAGPVLAGEARDEQAVRMVEDRWSQAFVSGDVTALGALLDERYVSIGAKGDVRTKDDVISLARRYAAAHPGEAATPLTASSVVRVIGDAALVTHEGAAERSVDVLYYRDGHWHAWYSQHTPKARSVTAVR